MAGEEFYQLPNAGARWESLHSIMGLAELYWATGNEDYRKAFEHHYWSIVKTDRHNNGGFTSGEQAQGNPYHRGAIETCCTVAWTAMGVEMLKLTGDSKVADELELSTLNQIVALHSQDGSWCTYNTPMDGVRIPSTEEISFQVRPGSEELNCCSVNAARGFGMISDWAFMKRGNGFAINYYGPCRFENSGFAIDQETSYPQAGRILMRVTTKRASRFPLSFRIPHWSVRSSLAVNGKPFKVKPGTYASVERVWKTGDKIELNLDMTPRVWVGQRESLGKASIYRGPILFALPLAGSLPDFQERWEGTGLRSSKEKGASVTYAFEGSEVRVRAERFSDGGKAEVSIDGKKVDTVDFFGPKNGEPFVWKRTNLSQSKHTLRLTVLAEKQAASRDVWINVVGFEPAPRLPQLVSKGLANASFTPEADGVGSITLMDETQKPVRLIDFGRVGRNRTPYYSWLPFSGMRGVPFSLSNPSRTKSVN